MKKANDYRQDLGVSANITLAELKTVYRNFVKANHPDKFQDPTEKSAAEERSKVVIEAYHYLVSINPETIEQTKEIYDNTVNTQAIADHSHDKGILKITFTDGSIYEYFSVPRNTYIKFVNADSVGRFAKRKIFYEFAYRNVVKSNQF